MKNIIGAIVLGVKLRQFAPQYDMPKFLLKVQNLLFKFSGINLNK